MTTRIILRDNDTSGQAPDPSDLVQGELVVNTTDGRLYTKDKNGNVVHLVSAGSPETASYSVTASYAANAGSTIDFSTGSYTGSFTGSLLGTASYASTASLLLGSVASSSYALTASYAANGGGSIDFSTGSYTGSFTGSMRGKFGVLDGYKGVDGNTPPLSSSVLIAPMVSSSAVIIEQVNYLEYDNTGYVDSALKFITNAGADSASIDFGFNGLFTSFTTHVKDAFVVVQGDSFGAPSWMFITNANNNTSSWRASYYQDRTHNVFNIDYANSVDTFHLTSSKADLGIISGSELYISNAITISGSLLGTASYAETASLLLGSIESSSYALTASYAANAGPAVNFSTGSYTGSFTGSLKGTSTTASFVSRSYVADKFTAGNASQLTAGTVNNARLPAQINVTGVTASLSAPIIKSYREKINNLGNIGYRVTASYTDGNVIVATVTGSVSMSITNVPTSEAASVAWYLTQNGTGNYQVNFSSSVSFGPDGAPTYSGPNKTDFISMTTVNGGAKWIATTVMNR